MPRKPLFPVSVSSSRRVTRHPESEAVCFSGEAVVALMPAGGEGDAAIDCTQRSHKVEQKIGTRFSSSHRYCMNSGKGASHRQER
jgi:hypothetical protein